MDDLTNEQQYLLVSMYNEVMSRQPALSMEESNYFFDSDEIKDMFLPALPDTFFLFGFSAQRIPSDNPEYFPFLIFRQLLDHRDQLLCILARLVQCVSSFPQLLTSFL